MLNFRSYLFAVICAVNLVKLSSGGELQCSGDSSDNTISLSINSVRSDAGEWATSFLAHQNTSVQPRNVDVNVTRRFVTCQGRYIVQIGGLLKDLTKEQNHTKLTFARCSKNAAITNDGRTLQKLKLDGQGSGFTNRHLKDGEIFTVRIDKKDGSTQHGLGIGLSVLTLDARDLQDHSYYYKAGTWMFYHTHLYQNGTVTNENYLKTNLKDVQVGQNIGVMRSRFGTLHLFIDGVDQGPAASNIPNKVFGVFELYGNVIKGTIVDV